MLPTWSRLARPIVVAMTVALLGSALVAAPGAAGGGVSARSILSGYSRPVFVTHHGRGSNIYIVEQTGKIKIARLVNDRWVKVGTFLDIRDRVLFGGEQGLLGLAFAPDYATSRKFYVNYTREPDGATVVAEFRRSAGSTNMASKRSFRPVLTISQPFSNHNGGMIAFGPDRLLYIGMGDGGDAGDPRDYAQDLGERLGKTLRIDPADPDGSGPRRYRIPSSNPYQGDRGRAGEIWSSGLRNPWRFSFDRVTGDLWIGDVGQHHREEIDKAEADRNGLNAGKKDDYGWNHCEGSLAYPSGARCGVAQHGPIRQYRHSGGRCSVTGGYVYRGTERPAWRGRYTYGDYCTGELWVIDQSGDLVTSTDTPYNITSFGEDAAGRLYATDLNGRILRVRFTGAP